jgi:hypothetical protein
MSIVTRTIPALADSCAWLLQRARARLHVVLEARQPVAPENGIAIGPPRHLAQRAGSELVDALSPVVTAAPLAHEARIAQHAKVARHGGSRHVERRGQLRHGRVALAQLIEDRAARRISDGEEGIGVSGGAGHGIGYE